MWRPRAATSVATSTCTFPALNEFSAEVRSCWLRLPCRLVTLSCAALRAAARLLTACMHIRSGCWGKHSKSRSASSPHHESLCQLMCLLKVFELMTRESELQRVSLLSHLRVQIQGRTRCIRPAHVVRHNGEQTRQAATACKLLANASDGGRGTLVVFANTSTRGACLADACSAFTAFKCFSSFACFLCSAQTCTTCTPKVNVHPHAKFRAPGTVPGPCNCCGAEKASLSNSFSGACPSLYHLPSVATYACI